MGVEALVITIATAVEEQGATTREIARNVSKVSSGTEEVTANISEVNKGNSSTGTAAIQVLSSAQVLSQQSGDLRSQVENFLTTIRQ